jgi:type I restriction enzyme S subunit
MNGQAIGTGVKYLRVADVEALTYSLPPYSEQLEIVQRVKELFEHAMQLKNNTRPHKLD